MDCEGYGNSFKEIPQKSFVHFQISTSSLKVFFVIKEKPLECVITCMHSLLKDFCKITKSKDVA